MKRDLPKFKISIDDIYSEGEDLGIEMIAYTAKPAILKKGFAFSDGVTKKFLFKDDSKQRIVAPVMIPMEIYRLDEFDEYYVEFTVEEIEKIHTKFMNNLDNRSKIFNIEHTSTDTIDAFVHQCWIVEDTFSDPAYVKYNIEVPVGTVMMITQVRDKEQYNNLVKEDMLGYSIEGFLGLALSELKMAEPPFHDSCKCEMVGDKVVSEPSVCDYCLEQKEKNNFIEMEENLKLPAGEYVMGDKIYVVKEDGSFEVKEQEVALSDAPVVEEEKKEEEVAMAEEVVEEEVKKEEELAEEVTADPVAEAVSYTKEEVDAKFEEILKLIGELKAEEQVEDVTEEEGQPVDQSLSQRFSAFVAFSKKIQ